MVAKKVASAGDNADGSRPEIVEARVPYPVDVGAELDHVEIEL